MKRAGVARALGWANDARFQSPRGDFGFLKGWEIRPALLDAVGGFNPLAGILVF